MSALDELIGASEAMSTVRENVQRLLARRSDARRMPPVLLLGQTGTGKGLLAKLLHRESARRAARMVELNCAAIPDTMLEAELFGYERGAFTDAREAKPGLIQVAHGGTLFLDEVGLLSVALQGKLLKVIEDQSVRRLGSTRVEPVDVWIIAATSDDLVAKCRDGRFREDLYHRLAVISFVLPPLRDRGADVVTLAHQFLTSACRDYGLPPKRLAPNAEAALRAFSWPGNVRQLGNVIERAVLLFDGPVISAEALALAPDAPPAAADAVEAVAEPGLTRDRRRDQLLAALKATDWNITRTAQRLMLARNTVKARMRQYGLTPESPHGTVAPPPPDAAVTTDRVAAPATAAVDRGQPGAVLWERRRLTVLRAEISLPDVTARWASDRLFGAVVDKVKMFGGRVEDLSPRVIVTIFGLDVIDDAARRAANAALAVLRTLREQSQGDATVTLAIHVSEFLVARLEGGTSIDTHSKRDASSVLEGLTEHAADNSVIVSGAAARFLSRRFELVPLETTGEHTGPRFRLAGRERPGFLPFADGGSFVGRSYDLEAAQRCLALAENGQGQVFAVVGDPGIGKSRLLSEFRRAIAGRACRVLEICCPSHGAAFPFLTIIDIVRELFDLRDGDDPHTVRDVVGQAAGKFGRALVGDELPATLALLDALPADDPHRLLAPAQRRQRVEEAVCRLIVAESARQPLVLMVEDLHWIDSDSRAVLDALVDRLPGASVMLVVSHRPEHRSDWTRKPYYQHVTLEPLTPASVRTVLDEMLGPDARLRSLKDAVVARTDGNPFFIEETVRTLAESGALVGRPGAYAVAVEAHGVEVPPTVQAVLTERMDRLGVDDKRVLQAAVVIGDGGSAETLAEVADVGASSLRSALDQLQRAKFLYETGRRNATTIVFSHSLVQEVAYASLPPDRRRALHLRCLAALEGRAERVPDDAVEQAAHHAVQGEAWEKAAGYARRAAGKAVARSAYRAAVSALGAALAALDKVPPTRETLMASVDVRFDLRNMLWALSELSQGLGVLQDALPLAEALGDRRRLARVFAHMSSNYWVLGDNERALSAGQEALTLARNLDDPAVRIDCNQLLGVLHHSLGQHHEACGYLERVIDEISAGDRAGRFATYYNVHSRTWLAWTLTELGDLDRAELLAEEAVAAAEASREVHNVIAARWGRGLVELARGAPARAIPLLRRAHEEAQSAEMALWARPTAAVLGRALAQAGEVSEGRRYLEFAVRGGENNVAVAAWQTFFADACLLDGDLEAAEAAVGRALDLAERRRERGFLAHAHGVAGDIALRRNDTERASRSYEDAIALAKAHAMAPLRTRCEAALDALHRDPPREEARSTT